MNNIFADYHLHSEFSDDCETNLESLIESAKNKGLSSICLTDHYDMDFPKEKYGIEFYLDIDNYIDRISELRNKLLPDFDLRIGVEQGLMPSTCKKLENYSRENKGIDFIICSSHLVDGKDPYYPDTFINEDGSPANAIDIYRQYFEEMLYIVKNFQDYNVYGHIDYIFRYGPKNVDHIKICADNYEEIIFSRFKDLFYEILKCIIENGKGIEINTGSLYRGMDFAHPHTLILKMYKELGGEILTFGSDAHDLEHLGYCFNEASEMAKGIGFKYFCTFKDMKPEFHKLSS